MKQAADQNKIGSAVAHTMVLCIFLFLLAACTRSMFLSGMAELSRGIRDGSVPDTIGGLGLLAGTLFEVVFGGCSGLWLLALSTREVKRNVHSAPSVHSALPATVVLLRGAEESPVAARDVLLRAATGQETPKEELLRVSQD